MGFDVQKYTRSRWLKGSDFEPGHQSVVTISKAYEYHFEQDGETKPVIDFKEIQQSLVLNKTQIKSLITHFGSDPDQWVGKMIMLMAVPSSFEGKMTILLQPAVTRRQSGAPMGAAPGREYSDKEAPGSEDWDQQELLPF